MSHFTRVKTQMVEKRFILQALDDLGYTWEAGGNSLRGFAGARRKVDILVKTRGYDIGLVKTGDHYEIIADWFGVIGVSREKFRNTISQRYAYHAAKEKLEQQGFSLVAEEEQKDGQIHLVLRRVAG